ncbi:MAG: signal recognition particle protein [Candidatus Cryosericum sp.]
MFESVKKALGGVFDGLRRKGLLSQGDIDAALAEIKLGLLGADVDYRVVKSFIARTREACLEEKVLKSITPGDQVVKVLYEQLTQALGGQGGKGIAITHIPYRVMLVGLQGSGKTTTLGKLALLFKKEGHYPLLIPGDYGRPAAYQQLQKLASDAGVEFYGEHAGSLTDLIQGADRFAREKSLDVQLLDTQGRHDFDTELMDELQTVTALYRPDETLIVLDSMIGSKAIPLSQSFNKVAPLTGAIFTKFDSPAQGGAVLSFKESIGKPVRYIGVGEHLQDLEYFVPERHAARIVGYGDIEGLLKRYDNAESQAKAAGVAKRVQTGKFDLYDLRDQLLEIGQVGGINKMLESLPANMVPKGAVADEGVAKRFTAIIDSMTDTERRSPAILNASRKRRVARGAGVDVSEINRMLKQFELFSRMAKMANNRHAGGFGLPGF